jgi:hypothetical protein
MRKFTITAYSKPVYDEWGFGDYWKPIDWMDWFNSLTAQFGTNEARKKWVAAFTDPLAPSFGVARADYLLLNKQFIDFLKINKIWDQVNTGLSGVVNDASSFVTDGAQNILQAGSKVVENSTGFLSNVTKFLPVIAILIIVIVVWFYYSKYKTIMA